MEPGATQKRAAKSDENRPSGHPEGYFMQNVIKVLFLSLKF